MNLIVSLADVTQITIGDILKILNSCLKLISVVIAFVSLFIEMNPKIKAHPISSFIKWIGRKANSELIEEVNNLKNTVDKSNKDIENSISEIKYNNSRREAVNCRVRILRFGDEIRQDIKHSAECFGQTIEDIDFYEKYCKEHPEFKNNKTVITTAKILEAYKNSMDNNDFL